MDKQTIRNGIASLHMAALMFLDNEMPKDVNFINEASQFAARKGITRDQLIELLNKPLIIILQEQGINVDTSTGNGTH